MRLSLPDIDTSLECILLSACVLPRIHRRYSFSLSLPAELAHGAVITSLLLRGGLSVAIQATDFSVTPDEHIRAQFAVPSKDS